MTNFKGIDECCVCGSKIGSVSYMVLENGKHICSKCADNIEKMVSSVRSFEEDHVVKRGTYGITSDYEDGALKPVLKPREIKGLLDQYVVGQEYAKKVLSVACYNHYKRNEIKDREIKKSNILMVGPTGSGKTYLVETLGKIIGVPVAIVAATSLTEAGYIGDDVETVVGKLLDAAGGDVKKAERGIIFIDEIDKLSSETSDTERKVGGKGVQQALLPLLEGSIVSIDRSGSNLRSQGFKVNVNTRGILFICGGAFPEAEEIIKKRLTKKSSIGFKASAVCDDNDMDETNLLLYITTDDLRQFGLIPEFIGRLPIIAPLESLSVEMLKKILTEPKNSLLSQYQGLMEFDGIKLTIDEEALCLIAERAYKKGTGARSLRCIMEDLLLDIMYNVPSLKGIDEVRISKECVEGIEEPLYYNASRFMYAAN